MTPRCGWRGYESATISNSGVSIANGQLNSPTITVSGGSFTVNIDTANGVKVTSGGQSVSLATGLALVSLSGYLGSWGASTFSVSQTTTPAVISGTTAGGATALTLTNTSGVSAVLTPTGFSCNGQAGGNFTFHDQAGVLHTVVGGILVS
jgi:hypothetical protein